MQRHRVTAASGGHEGLNSSTYAQFKNLTPTYLTQYILIFIIFLLFLSMACFVEMCYVLYVNHCPFSVFVDYISISLSVISYKSPFNVLLRL